MIWERRKQMKVQIGTEYCAMEIAEYAVSRRYRHDTPISNLQLQKILYFLQVIHASETGELLFADQFEAWPYGPVIRDVYVKFSDCGGFPIKREFDTEINDSIRPFLDAGVDMLAEKSPWELVRISHAEGSPWDVIYNQKRLHKGIIPNELIMQPATLCRNPNPGGRKLRKGPLSAHQQDWDSFEATPESSPNKRRQRRRRETQGSPRHARIPRQHG